MVDLQQISIPITAQDSLKAMLAQKSQIDAQFNMYIRGLRDSLGVDGEGWTIDVEAMAFVRKLSQDGSNGVGTIAGNLAGTENHKAS